MLKLAIVSRDYLSYQKCFNAVSDSFAQLELVHADTHLPIELASQVDILLCEPKSALPNLSQMTNLQWMHSSWAGNNVLQQHDKRDYRLSATKGIFSAQMREYVFAYLLYFQRQIADFAEAQAEQKWQNFQLDTLAGKRLGIMGMGNIGCDVARTALHFDMSVSAITHAKRPLKEVDYYTLDNLLDFATDCDYILNLLPETVTTQGICDETFFRTMKSSAVFINAGRGSVLHSDQVLVNALQTHQLKAAVLDVFTQEPLPSDHAFYDVANCFVTNHSAAVSDPEKVFSVFVKNLRNYLENKPLLHEHDFIKGY